MEKGINVLSLFDGISAGQVALERAGVKVDRYYASEIDKYPIQVTQENYPDTIQLGDINNWREWDIDWSSIDLVMGGFPCQSWSMAGKQGGVNDDRGKLLFVMMDVFNKIKGVNPYVRFLFENVKMKKEFLEYVNSVIGVEPILINSALVSAQNRKRYYWTNIDGADVPNDKGILLKDVLEGMEELVGARRGRYIVNGVRQDGKMLTAGKTTQYLEIRRDNKSNCLTTVQKDNIVIRDKSKCVRAGGRGSYDRHEWDSVDKDHTRKLTVVECERLQTFPDNYTDCVSNTQRYKALGNSWTVDVIAHIFKGLKD